MAVPVLCSLWLLGVGAAAVVPAETTEQVACPQCAAVSDREQAARLKVEAIKQQILSKLHLQDKPNITSPLPREIALEALRRTQGKLPGDQNTQAVRDQGTDETIIDKDDYYARTSEIIAFAEPGHSLNGHVLLDFYPSHEHAHRLRVTAATLWIQLRYSSSLPRQLRYLLRDHQLTLYVFKVLTTPRNHTEPLQLELLTSYRLGNVHVGWRRLEVGSAVQEWFAGQQKEKLTLLVDCVGCDSLLEMVLFNEDGEEVNKTVSLRKIRHSGGGRELVGLRPFLAIATETTEQKRVKRHSVTCDSQMTHCCKQNLYVSFKELGWDDWIIAPKGYYANYCMGDCASMHRTPDTFATFHTHVIEEYRSRNPYASINPCCAPTRLSPMSLIYFDPDLNIIKTDLPKMIVDECGCT